MFGVHQSRSRREEEILAPTGIRIPTSVVKPVVSRYGDYVFPVRYRQTYTAELSFK
jgi:hypothetical protein